MLRTKLCDLLGVEYPILQAGMGHVALSDLAAAVSNAGGFGVLGAATLTPDEFDAELKRMKSLTSKPFGVDLVFPAHGLSTAAAFKMPDKIPTPILRLRQELREKGIEAKEALIEPTHTLDVALKKAEILLDHGVTALASGLGTPESVIKECRAHGVRVIALVGTPRQAQRVAALGADIVVAQGHDAGGHTGRIGTLSLVPQVVDAVQIPVVAAGGIMDGRGLVAALALGACGVWMGTRFIATPEAITHPLHKEAVLKSSYDSTVWSLFYDSLGHRHIKNRWEEAWEGHEDERLPYPLQRVLMAPVYYAARDHSLLDYMALSMGQGSGMVKEMKGAGEIVKEIVAQATQILKERLPGEVRVS